MTMTYSAPCGVLVLGAYGDALCMCIWQESEKGNSVRQRLRKLPEADFREGITEVTDEAARQLDEYFAGVRRIFDIPLLFAGTAFQKEVWQALLHIPYGRTLSYSELAREIGRPSAVRAVAGACGANPISIFAPCHRVTGSDRSLTGYAGGLAAKKHLLNLESMNSMYGEQDFHVQTLHK